MPCQVIVVDQSTPAYVLEPFSQLVHLHDTQIAGLTAAPNRGVDASYGDVVLFFDDDVVLETDCVLEVARAFAERPEVIGAQCCISNPDAPPLFYVFTERLFRLGFFNARPVRSAGRPVETVPRLIGGLASAYRRTLFDYERFDENLTGYGYAEDWDMTKRAARHGALAIVGAARVRHLHSPKNRANRATIAKLRRRNFLYLYQKLGGDQKLANRICKEWFLVGEALHGIKWKIADLARSFSTRRHR